MSAHSDPFRPAKIIGLVSYPDPAGVRRQIPIGDVQIREAGEAVLIRSTSKPEAEYLIPLSDYISYVQYGQIELKASEKGEPR